MENQRKSLSTAKGKDISRRAKPLIAKAGIDRNRTTYKYG